MVVLCSLLAVLCFACVDLFSIMPSRCCVTNCKGNYDGASRVSVFRFPKDEILCSKWIKAIRWKDFKVTSASRVCVLHFQPTDIEREVSVFDKKKKKTGRTICVPLQHPRLKKHVVPSVFPGCPSYLTSSKQLREGPEERRLRKENYALQKVIQESMVSKEEYDSRMKVDSFEELILKLETKYDQNDWTMVRNCDQLLLLKITSDPAPTIMASLVISNTLETTAFLGKVNLSSIGKKHKLPCKLTDINELFSILNELAALCSNQTSEKNRDICVDNVQSFLKMLQDSAEGAILSSLQFLHEQVSLLFTKKERIGYSPEFLVFSTLLYSISPHAYRFLRSSQNVILPHPNTLRRVCAKYEMNPKFEQYDNGFLRYMNYRFQQLKPEESMVTLMMDEIHIKPYLDFKGGNIMGTSYDSKNAATSAYVFMISSLLSPYKDVVHILPVCKLSAESLHQFLLKLILGLENIGFQIVCIVSDNNAINRKAVSFFCQPPKLSIAYGHPADNTRPLFFAFDSVHLLKCIRNNWVNQKNIGQCLFYPEYQPSVVMDGDDMIESICCVSFLALKKLHQAQSSQLLKFGHGLSLKALYPSNIEKQNVLLALKIFSQTVSEGLKHIGGDIDIPHAVTTANFIEKICTRFEIVNVKTPKKSERYKNVYHEPLTFKQGDQRLRFLLEFIEWLECWEKCNISTGTLTKETHSALIHTAHAIVEITRYCSDEHNFAYIRPGKIQTDLLEERFGKYRRLAGSQYNVSLTQVFETETKLRVQNCIPFTLKSSKFGNIIIENFDDSLDEDLGENLNTTFPSELCLLCPHSDIVRIIMHNYIVIQKLVSDENEQTFLKLHSQRNAAFELTFQSVIEDDCLQIRECPDHTLEFILKHLLWASTNTLLKNYCNERNDVSKITVGKKRKLMTLSQPS